MARWSLVWVVLALAAGTGCGSDAPADATTTPLGGTAAGAPLELRDTAPPAAARCAECDHPAGAQHRCGASRLCTTCGVDAALSGHRCKVSRFCATCGREAALLGHRCGLTAFDAARNADVERDDIDEYDDVDDR